MAKRKPDKKQSVHTRRRVLLAMGFVNHQRQAGIVRYAREVGWMVDSRLTSFHAVNRDQEYLVSSHYDGVLTLMSRIAPWLPPLLRTMKVPIVDLWNDYPDERYPRVLLDHPATGRAAAEYLLERGFRDVLFYAHTIEGGSAAQRRDAFRKTILAAGARFHELWWDHNHPPDKKKTRLQWLAASLAKMPTPLGLLGANDAIAGEALEAIELAQLQVPRQIAVLGIDNDPLVTELARVPLSSVDTCREQLGYEAAALLDRLMDGQPAPTTPILIPPGRIITRRSTDVLAVDDAEVAAALQYIRDHFVEPITVDDVAINSAVSRRHLQERFSKSTGRTIADTITNVRIDHAKKLLAETQGKLDSIARQSGFGTGERMSKVFRRVLDLTPQEFRARNSGHISS